jgi:hypothetical protein
MTLEQEADLIDEMAAEICYADFTARGLDYGGPKKYWKGVVEAKKESYRREARAALRIAWPIIRDGALEDAASMFVSEQISALIRALKSKGQNV